MMDGKGIVVAGIALTFCWAVGIAMIIYPYGASSWLLQKWARFLLQMAHSSEWLYTTWTHARGIGGLTYYEWLEQLATNPIHAMEKYALWAVWFARLSGILWLWGTSIGTHWFFKIVLQGG